MARFRALATQDHVGFGAPFGANRRKRGPPGGGLYFLTKGGDGARLSLACAPLSFNLEVRKELNLITIKATPSRPDSSQGSTHTSLVSVAFLLRGQGPVIVRQSLTRSVTPDPLRLQFI